MCSHIGLVKNVMFWCTRLQGLYYFIFIKINFDMEFAPNGIERCVFLDLCFSNIIVLNEEHDE
jgi:hypothetical protein